MGGSFACAGPHAACGKTAQVCNVMRGRIHLKNAVIPEHVSPKELWGEEPLPAALRSLATASSSSCSRALLWRDHRASSCTVALPVISASLCALSSALSCPGLQYTSLFSHACSQAICLYMQRTGRRTSLSWLDVAACLPQEDNVRCCVVLPSLQFLAFRKEDLEQKAERLMRNNACTISSRLGH